MAWKAGFYYIAWSHIQIILKSAEVAVKLVIVSPVVIDDKVTQTKHGKQAPPLQTDSSAFQLLSKRPELFQPSP